jgi:hypothetical protein
VSLRIVGIQFNGSLELPFRGGPIPLIPLVFYRQCQVSVGVRLVDRQRLLSRLPLLWAPLRRDSCTNRPG